MAADGFSCGLFGATVAGGAKEEGGLGGSHDLGGGFGGVTGGLFNGFSEAEVEDFYCAFGGDDDVAGFEDAVDNTPAGRGFEGFPLAG